MVPDTRGEAVSPMTARSWVIEVCATCDRLAVWPYCEHGRLYRLNPWRPLVTPPRADWTKTVVVVPEERPADE